MLQVALIAIGKPDDYVGLYEALQKSGHKLETIQRIL